MSMRHGRYNSGDLRRLRHLQTGESSGSARYDSRPIVAVESRSGGFEPRRPDPFEIYEYGFSYNSDDDLTDHLMGRERHVIDYTEIASRVILEGYFQFFEFLRVEVQPADADFLKYPYGGFPPEAFHRGVTQDVLKLRHVGVMAAMVRLGALNLNEAARSKLSTVEEEISLALDVVARSWERAFAEQKSLPPGTPEYYRRAQFWLPPRIYTRLANTRVPAVTSAVDDWS